MAKSRRRFFGLFAEGPPDLDEWLRQFGERLRRAFGGGERRRNPFAAFEEPGDGARPPREPPKIKPGWIGVGVGTVVLLGYLLAGFYTVDESERAVLFRLGRAVGVKGAGLKWRLPLIEDYRIVNVSGVRRVEVGYRGNPKNKIAREALMLTDNLNIVDIQFAVQYVLKDPEDYLFENRSPEDAVLQVAETAMREIVGKNQIDFVLYEGREEIADEAKGLMQMILDRYKTGILVRQVAVQNVQPPDQVQEAFEDAVRARKDLDRKIDEGEAYANNVIPRAKGRAARILAEAEGYRQSVIARAEGETRRFLQLAGEYQKAPAVTRKRMYLEVLEEVFANNSKILIDQKEGGSSLFYLPLDKLLENRAAPAAPAAGERPPPSPAATAAPSPLDQIRERLRRELQSGEAPR